MPKVGRNAPCPCGSGRKYKQCCQPKELAAQVRSLGLRRDEELLWARLMAFAQRPAFRVDLQSAFSRFWNGDYDLDAAEGLEREQVEAFLDWYIHDYRTGQERQRIVDLFAAEEGPRLTPDQRALLSERESTYLSLYGVESVDPDGRLEVGDLLAGGYYKVEDPGLARLAMPGDLLLGRRLGNEEDGRMSRSTVLLPAALGPEMVAAAKRAYGAYRDENYQGTWPEFLRESGYVLYHFLGTREADEGYGRAPRREGYFDPRAAIEGMRAIMRRHAEEAAKRAEEERKKAEEEEEEDESRVPPVERTEGGILIPGRPKPPAGAEKGILLPEHYRK